MRFSLFIKDRITSIAVTFTAWIAMLIFFGAFHMSCDQVVIISVIYFIASIIRTVLEYCRKRSFYSLISENSNKLDKKYLLSETVEKPEFYEGEIFYDALQKANKSMCENVSSYRRNYAEFREYIEIWVHEVKLPVSSMMLMCHNKKENSGKFSEQLKRIDDYIENVLYYARSENTEKDYLIKEISLKKAFADTAMKYREELQQNNVALKTENLDISVLTDGKWLEYILGQLMANSMKYISSEREPEISVYAEVHESMTVLHFRDNGIGIPTSDLPYIFEKSFTGENGRTHAKSTGMGLYIIKTLCGKLGVGISADSVREEYTEIILTFGKNDFLKMN